MLGAKIFLQTRFWYLTVFEVLKIMAFWKFVVKFENFR